MKFNSNTRQLVLEVLSVLLLVACHFIIQWKLSPYHFTLRDGSIRWIPIAISVTPSLLFYGFARLILPNILSMALVISADVVLAIINLQKLGRINEVLGWTDLTNLSENISVVLEFVQPIHFVIIGAAMLALLAAYWLNRKVHNTPAYFCYKLLLIGLLTPVVFNTHLVYADVLSRHNSIATYLRSAGVNYIRSQWHKNLRVQGLAMHLVQTSARVTLSAPSADELRIAEQTDSYKLDSVHRSKKIIIILCEACWADKNHFSKEFQPLIDLGFKSARGISPSYGGGTANASFEWQTGLPANNVLTGVIYQEYSGVMREKLNSIAQSLHSEGFRTVAAHNYKRKFWHRHEMMPKLGYDEFIGIEDMQMFDYKPNRYGWIDDGVMYANIRDHIDSEGPAFLYLTTMYTHAPFRQMNDLGQADFANRVSTTVNRIAEFVKYVKDRHDATIVVYGDHKPMMTDFYLSEGIFSPDMFLKIGKNNAGYLFKETVDRPAIGDVPVYIYDKDEARVNNFISEADGLPFFCQSALLNKHFIGTQVLSHQFALKNSLCSPSASFKLSDLEKSYPAWLYSVSLF
ncbi:LTA synthase family protein [Hydrogenophaga sp. 5NK40-0174]|uniref:LTA synthase family protein n=1 Tax=Hydrogenophaga sp. 5NK40-0174 TaxID=3127649 RepID=UPI003108D057